MVKNHFHHWRSAHLHSGLVGLQSCGEKVFISLLTSDEDSYHIHSCVTITSSRGCDLNQAEYEL